MADISTAVSMARVPILGENGRISDDYIPAAIGENVTKAEAAATRAETAAAGAEGSASAASTSATQASGSASAASASASQAQQSATTASGAATSAQSAQTAAEAAKTAAEAAQSAAAGSAQDAQQSATAAAESAASVADKYISSAQATTLEPGSQATASVADQVLTIGVPKGDKGDPGEKGDPGDKGDPGATGAPGAAATIAVGSVSTLPAGSEATVENVGTANAARLDFGIPKGDKGDKGDPGVGVPEGGTPGQLLSKTDSGTAWVDPPSTGNILTGEAEGYVAHAEDAYAQKPIEVRVKGRTVKNLWPVINGSSNGVTVSTDETGLITVSGTATADATVTAEAAYAPSSAYVMASTYGTPSTWYIVNGETQVASGTKLAAPSATCGVTVKSGTTVNASLRVMLVEGTEVPDCFTPPASITSVQTGNLMTSGKNLLKSDKMTQSYSNNISDYVHLPSGTYTFSAGGGPFGQIIIESRVHVISSDNFSVSKATFTLPYPEEIRVRTWNSDADSVFTFDPQLELGSTATEFEPPNVTTTPLPEVELRSLPDGTCDELVIKSDGTATVERRTQLVDGKVVALDTPTTEPQSPVTLPVLPAPTFDAYHDSDVPSDTTVTYERDINIAFDNLAKQVAGTASAVAVREASTIEEE